MLVAGVLFGFAPFQLFLTRKRTRCYLVKAISQQLVSVQDLVNALEDLALLQLKVVASPCW